MLYRVRVLSITWFSFKLFLVFGSFSWIRDTRYQLQCKYLHILIILMCNPVITLGFSFLNHIFSVFGICDFVWLFYAVILNGLFDLIYCTSEIKSIQCTDNFRCLGWRTKDPTVIDNSCNKPVIEETYFLIIYSSPHPDFLKLFM